jgi:hypothetical protein
LEVASRIWPSTSDGGSLIERSNRFGKSVISTSVIVKDLANAFQVNNILKYYSLRNVVGFTTRSFRISRLGMNLLVCSWYWSTL